MPPPLFDSFFMAGFECSSHRRKDMVRLDLIRRTGHDRHALSDCRHCARLGLRTIRDGLRWHLIETAPRVYDWSSWVPMLEAAAEAGVQVVWDIFHYGSPDHLDQGSPEFIDAYARFAAEAVRVHRSVVGAAPLVCPINEISFFAWAVNTGYFPLAGPQERGWFKRQLVRAALAGVAAMRSEEPDCRFIWAEPLIHVVPRNRSAREKRTAEDYRQGQFEAFDLLTGRSEPELGGHPSAIDAIGLNFYPDNQWYYQGGTVPLGHYEHRALSEMLAEVWERYGKPILISETGAEGAGRAAWFHYVCDEVRGAMSGGVRVEGICLYPVTAFPGWDNSRPTQTGLFSAPNGDGERSLYQPLADELQRQRGLIFPAGAGSER